MTARELEDPYKDGGILFGTDDLFDESIEKSFRKKFEGSLSEAKCDVLKVATKSLASDLDSLEIGYPSKRGWMLQLARQLMTHFQPDERNGGGRLLAPFALPVSYTHLTLPTILLV